MGRQPRRARRPTSSAGAGSGSRRVAAAWCGARPPRCAHDGRANPHQLVIDRRRRSPTSLRSGSVLAPAAGRGAAAHALGPLVLGPTAPPAPRTAYAHPILDARAGAERGVGADRRRARRARRDIRRRRGARAPTPASTSSTSSTATATSSTSCSLHTTGRGATAVTSRAAPRFLRTVVAGIRARAPRSRGRGAAVDVRPRAVRRRRADGIGEPESRPRSYPYAFGGDGTGLGHRPHRDARVPRHPHRPRHRLLVQRHRRQPVLQPARTATRVLPAVGRLPAARGSARRRRPSARNHRRARRTRTLGSRSSAPATRTCRTGCRTSRRQ